LNYNFYINSIHKSAVGIEDTTNWNKMFDNNGNYDCALSVAIDSRGNVYVVGYSYNIINSTSGADWWIKKFDKNGVEDVANWNKVYDGNGDWDFAKSVAIDSNDNVYIAGMGHNITNPKTSV